MTQMMRRLGCLWMAVFLLSGCVKKPAAEAQITKNHDTTTDLLRTSEHEPITWDLIEMTEHNAELKHLLETAIQQAHEINPDPDSNPVDSLESYYAFMDRAAKALPWQVSPSGTYSKLYDQIDQGMGCFYFISDQPLEELSDKGYYNNSLVYHEPYRSWLIRFISEYGQFLRTDESWNDTYYQTAKKNEDFNLTGDLYESPSNWKSFNDFFARKLSDLSKRPIAQPDDNSVVVSPADSKPQGLWKIDGNSHVIMNEGEEGTGVAIKTGTLTDVSVLLGDSAYKDAFANGALTHTFLDIQDYHRYHVPVSGTVKELLLIPGDDAPGGKIVWDAREGRYKEEASDIYGWQSIETRGVVILETETGALVAIVPVGMCTVSSINFEETIQPGAVVRKGDPLGYFLFGGSDIVMIFSETAAFEMTTEPQKHIEMGTAYGTIAR